MSAVAVQMSKLTKILFSLFIYRHPLSYKDYSVFLFVALRVKQGHSGIKGLVQIYWSEVVLDAHPLPTVDGGWLDPSLEKQTRRPAERLSNALLWTGRATVKVCFSHIKDKKSVSIYFHSF